MTKKDYILIAKVFNGGLQSFDGKAKKEAVIDLARALTVFLASENPKFDRSKFLLACGVNSK